MKTLFGLFLLALAFFAPDVSQAASRFAVCTTTCTWDNSSTAMWSATSGGATGASAPVAGDTVTFDAATCVGGTTCTVTTFSGTISVASITWGACTASTTGCIIKADTNNTNFTVSGSGGTSFNGAGSGTRKWLAGTGTYSLTIGNTNGCFDFSTVTNDQGSVFSGATWSCTITASALSTAFTGSTSLGPTTINGNSSGGATLVLGTSTWASLGINAPNFIQFQSGVTQTITGALTVTGTSNSSNVTLAGNSLSGAPTLSLGAASTATWVMLRYLTTSGAAALAATNCFQSGVVTLANSGTCATPGGVGGGGRIIGG